MAKQTHTNYAPTIKQIHEALGSGITVYSFNEEINIDQLFEIVVENPDGAFGYLHLIADDAGDGELSTHWRWLTTDPETQVVMKGSTSTLIEAAKELGAAMESLFGAESE